MLNEVVNLCKFSVKHLCPGAYLFQAFEGALIETGVTEKEFLRKTRIYDPER